MSDTTNGVRVHGLDDISSGSDEGELEFVSTPRASPTLSLPSNDSTAPDTSTETDETGGTDGAETETDSDVEEGVNAAQAQLDAVNGVLPNNRILSNPEVITAEKLFYVLSRRGPDGKVYFKQKDLGKLAKKYHDDMPRILIQLAKLDPALSPIEMYPYDLFTGNTTEVVNMLYNVQLKRVGGDKRQLTSTFPPPGSNEQPTIDAEATKLERLMRQDDDGTWKLRYYQVRRVWGESVKKLAVKFKVPGWKGGVQKHRGKWDTAFVVDGVISTAVERKEGEADVAPLLGVAEAEVNYPHTVVGHPGDFALLYGDIFADEEVITDPFDGFTVDERKQEPVEEIRRPAPAPVPSRPPPRPTTSTRVSRPTFSAEGSAHVALDRTTTRRWIDPSPGMLPSDQPLPFIYPPNFLCGQLRSVKDYFYPFTLNMLYVSACNPVFYYTMVRETYHDKQQMIDRERTDLKMTLYRVMSRYYSLHPVESMGKITEDVQRMNTSAKSLYDYFFATVDPQWLGLESRYLDAAKAVARPTTTLDGGGDIVLLAYLQERATLEDVLPWSHSITTGGDTAVHFSLTMEMNVGPTITGEWAKYRVSAVLTKNQLLLWHLGSWYVITKHRGTGNIDVDIKLYDTRGQDLATIKPDNNGFVLLNRVR